MDFQSLATLSPKKLIDMIRCQLADPMARNTYFTGMIIRQLGIKTYETSYAHDWQKLLSEYNLSTNMTSFAVFEGCSLIGIYSTEIDAVNIASHDNFKRVVIQIDNNGKVKQRMPWIYSDD
jgi:hypothetical protein